MASTAACLTLILLLYAGVLAGATNENYTVFLAEEGNVLLEGQNLKFLVMSDMHAYTPFSFNTAFRQTDVWRTSQRVLKLIKQEHGGELVLSPGDSVSYGGRTNNKIADMVGIPQSKMNEAVYTSSFQAFNGLQALYSSVNYTLIAAIGDHEIGGKYCCTGWIHGTSEFAQRVISCLSIVIFEVSLTFHWRE